MEFVISDALEFVRTEQDIPDIAKRVRYIAPLFHSDVHIYNEFLRRRDGPR